MENPDATTVLRELYHKHHIFEEKFRRCTLEASEDEFFFDRDLKGLSRWRALLFRGLLQWAVPAYRYFGLSGHAGVGLSKIVVPVHLSQQGIRVEIPEFPLRGRGDIVDPDTLQPTETPFVRV